jgi:hypothetical protein
MSEIDIMDLRDGERRERVRKFFQARAALRRAEGRCCRVPVGLTALELLRQKEESRQGVLFR